MTTVVDVARRAGVSISTVSRVLSGQAAVAAPTRERVLAAIEALEFRPNPLAQGLRLGRSRAVAFAVGDIEQNVYPTLARVVQGLLEESGYDLMLFNLGHSPERFDAMLARARDLRLSGIVLATSDIIDAERLRAFRLAEGDCPVVVLGQDLSADGVPSVWHDDTDGAYRATRHLIAIGCRRLGYVGRIAGSAMGGARFEGYRRAVVEAFGALDRDRVWDNTYRYPAGYRAMADAVERGIALDGMITGSDELALGVMAAASDRGIAVPDDLSVVGFGDVEWGAHVRPSLTTLSNDFPLMAERVRALIGDPPAAGAAAPSLRIARRLVLRDSVRGGRAGTRTE